MLTHPHNIIIKNDVKQRKEKMRGNVGLYIVMEGNGRGGEKAGREEGGGGGNGGRGGRKGERTCRAHTAHPRSRQR